MRVAIALSGGMDSLRAAWLLKEAGHDVVALHMRLFPSFLVHEAREGQSDVDRESRLQAVAARLDIPLFFVDCRDPFEHRVIRPFIEAYRNGLTPNPCVWCNSAVKFGHLLEKAVERGAERFATGHYVRKKDPQSSAERFALQCGVDARKDQSYFLYGLNQEQLSRALFPLGEETKESTRAWARSQGLDGLIPEESQEICFIPSGDYRRFVQDYAPEALQGAEGPVRDTSGTVIGRHKGLFRYTVGQRRGIDIPSSAPYYVLDLDPKTNTLWVGRAHELFTADAVVGHLNWVAIKPPTEPIRAMVRIRHQHRPAPARIIPLPDGTVRVLFETPQRAVTPGQAAVFYDGDVVLGGGLLEKKTMEPTRDARRF